MERLTYEIIDGGMVTDKENIKEFEIEDRIKVYAGNAVFRLADYEDTGLTPPEIMELKERDAMKSPEEIQDAFGDTRLICPNCRNSVINYFNRGRPAESQAKGRMFGIGQAVLPGWGVQILQRKRTSERSEGK